MNAVYVFSKSGSKVTVVPNSESFVQVNPGVKPIRCVDVERVDTLNRMTVPMTALIKLHKGEDVDHEEN